MRILLWSVFVCVLKWKKSKEIVCIWGNQASNNITQVCVRPQTWFGTPALSVGGLKIWLTNFLSKGQLVFYEYILFFFLFFSFT